jgi:hypothetical protein
LPRASSECAVAGWSAAAGGGDDGEEFDEGGPFGSHPVTNTLAATPAKITGATVDRRSIGNFGRDAKNRSESIGLVFSGCGIGWEWIQFSCATRRAATVSERSLAVVGALRVPWLFPAPFSTPLTVAHGYSNRPSALHGTCRVSKARRRPRCCRRAPIRTEGRTGG